MKYAILSVSIAIAMFSFGGCKKSDEAAPAPTNQAPVVSAGSAIDAPFHTGDPYTFNLAGTATDDNFGSTTLTVTWSKVSGPGTVTFGNASVASTTATVDALGTYQLRLTGTDGTLTSTSDVTAVVSEPFITVAGVEFDIRHSADPVFAAVDAPQVDLYGSAAGTVPPGVAGTTRYHNRFTYASDTNRSVPCVKSTITFDMSYVPASDSYSTVEIRHLAQGVDGSVYVLRSEITNSTNGTPGAPTISEPASDPIVFWKPLPASPSYPYKWQTGPGTIIGGVPNTVPSYGYDAAAQTSPNGVASTYRVVLPSMSIRLSPSAQMPYSYYNPMGATPLPGPFLWPYFKAGKGIVDFDGASFVAPAAN